MKRGLILFCLCCSAWASDQQREADNAALLQGRENANQSVWLQQGKHRFLALRIAAEKPSVKQAAIIVHDAGQHPDQLPLIHELRILLPHHGWTSLALQMPLRESGATTDDYYPLFDEASQRITAALSYLQQQDIQQVVLIGHGLGAMMASYAINRQPNAVKALVTLSLPLTQQTVPKFNLADFIKDLNIPFLDLYAEFDQPEVLDNARDKRLLAVNNPMYRQIRLDGENHAYQTDPVLAGKRIYSWLATALKQ